MNEEAWTRIGQQRIEIMHTQRKKSVLAWSYDTVHTGWRSGVVVSALASINEVNARRARLVLRWVTVSGFNSRCQTFISVFNQSATQG